MIPKGTPAGTIANIAHVAVENVKIAGKMATGELTVKEGLEKMEQTRACFKTRKLCAKCQYGKLII